MKHEVTATCILTAKKTRYEQMLNVARAYQAPHVVTCLHLPHMARWHVAN